MAEQLVFINYRTADTATAASALARALKREFEPGQVFIDYLGLPGGEPWREHLLTHAARADVLFVLIGKGWVTAIDVSTGERRIDQADDWVRQEIECALMHSRKVVPVLVDDAPVLNQDELPPSIRAIANLQALPFRTTGALASDVRRIVNLLENRGFQRVAHPWLVSPDSVYSRVELHRFVGRGWLMQLLDDFVRTHPNGYFVVEAQSGLGKTAFLARLVEARGCIHHFVELQPGAAGLLSGLRNISAQIIRSFGLEQKWIDDLLGAIDTRADYLERLLVAAASRRRGAEPVIIVVDGLDQAGAPDGQNVLALPQRLPEGFFFVVSQRPVDVRLHVQVPRKIVQINAIGEANLSDIADYVRSSLAQEGAHVEELVRRSGGNWMYAYYICREIHDGTRDPKSLDGLPYGLWQYYARFWMEWRSRDAERWARLHLRVLCALGAAQEGVTLPALAELTGLPELTDGAVLYPLLTVEWRPFVTVMPEPEGERFHLYHASLRDFVACDVPLDELTSAESAFAQEIGTATRARHAAIAAHWLKQWGGTSLGALRATATLSHRSSYGWRHVVEHLAQAGDFDTLSSLLRAEWVFQEEIPVPLSGWRGLLVRWARRRQRATHLSIPRNAWFESHARSGDLALFLEDWARAARSRWIAGPSGPREKHPGRAFELAAFLVRSSVREAAEQVPAEIPIALARCGRWSADQAVAYARQVADGAARAELLAEILALDNVLGQAVLREAVDAVDTLPSPGERIEGYARLLSRCPGDPRAGLVQRALAVLPELEDKAFAECAPQLVAYLADTDWASYLAAIDRLAAPLTRLRVLAASAEAAAAAAPEEFRLPLVERLAVVRQQCLAEAQDAADGPRALALATVASVTTDSRRGEFALGAIETARRAISASREALQEEPYEAIAVVASTCPQYVSDELLASTIEALLSIRIPDKPSPGLFILAVTGNVTTIEQLRSKLAARLIGVAPARALDRIERAVLRAQVRFQDWHPHGHLARRYAQLENSHRAIRIARRIGLRPERMATLSNIASDLDESGVRAALALVDSERARLASVKVYSDNRHFEAEQADVVLPAMVGLLPRLAALGGSDAEGEALALLRGLWQSGDRHRWSSLVAGIARSASPDALDEILRIAMASRDAEQAVVTIAQLSPFLPEEQVRKLVPAVHLVGYSQNSLERRSWTRVQRSTGGIRNVHLRVGALHAVSGRLAALGHPMDALQEVARLLRDAEREQTSIDMAACLGEIASGAPKDALALALDVAAMHNPQRRAGALQSLAPALMPEQMGRALDIARSAPEAGCRAWGIACLLPYLPERERPALASEAMRSLDQPFWNRALVLGLLAPFADSALKAVRIDVQQRKKAGVTSLLHLLPNAAPALAAELVELATAAYDDGLMLELAAFVPEPTFRAGLARVTENMPEWQRGNDRLSCIAQRLLLMQDVRGAFGHVLKIEDRFLRARLMCRMVGALQRLPREDALALWREQAQLSAGRGRSEAFGFAAALAPLLFVLEGLDAISALNESIAQSVRWWY